jgi:hypothetical protein
MQEHAGYKVITATIEQENLPLQKILSFVSLAIFCARDAVRCGHHHVCELHYE